MRSWMIAFSLGVWLATLAPALPSVNVSWLLACAAVIALTFRNVPLLGAYLLGISWCLLALQTAHSELLPKEFENKDIWVEGRIDGLLQTNADSQRFHFRVQSYCPELDISHCDGQWNEWPVLIRLNDYSILPLSAGEQVILQVRLKRPHGFANPHSFDYEAWLWEQGIRATGYVKKFSLPEHIKHDSWRSILSKARSQLHSNISKTAEAEIPAGLTQLPIILALTMGDRYSINDAQWEVFRQTGTTHLMVISGLHIGLMAWLFFRLARGLWARSTLLLHILPAPRAAAIAGITGAFLYCAIAGFSLAASRALIMVTLVLWGQWSMHTTRPVNSLCLALGFILLLNPLAPLTAGFWLSFGAVALLLIFALAPSEQPNQDALKKLIEDTQNSTSPLLITCSTYLRTQWVLLAGLFPLMCVFIGQVSLLAPVVNLFAIPLVGLIVVPLCLLGMVLSLFTPGLAAYPLLWADFLLEGLQQLLQTILNALPFSALALPALPWWAIALLTLSCILLLSKLHWKWRSLAVIGFMPLFLPTWFPGNNPVHGEAHFHVMDVGQGLAILIETRHHLFIYDAGPIYSERFNAGGGVILPYISRTRLLEPGHIFISHGDSDHAGGLAALVQAFPNMKIFSGEPKRMNIEGKVNACNTDEILHIDGVEFQMLQSTNSTYKANNLSCMLRISTGEHHVLIPGDIEREVEHELIGSSAELLKADVLIAPHHGSQTSSSPGFIYHVDPQLVIFTNGYLNRYGHPHEKILARYVNRGITTMQTANAGAVFFTLNNQGISELEGWRRSSPRIWRNGR